MQALRSPDEGRRPGAGVGLKCRPSYGDVADERADDLALAFNLSL